MIREEFETFLNDGKRFLEEMDFQEAIRRFELALEKSYMMGSDADSLIVNEFLGKAYRKMKNPEKALEYYKESLVVYEDLKDTRGVTRVLNKIALILYANGNLKESLQYHMKCLEACREGKDKKSEAIILKNIGIIHSKLGNHILALKAHTASLDIKRKLGDRRGEALSLFYLGQSQIDTGEYDKSRENLERSLKIFRRLGLKEDVEKVRAELEDLDNLQDEIDLEIDLDRKFHFGDFIPL
ncbi:MAG: tetratricopeptide repeat protein [Promethearchaeota archaeon]